MSIALAVGLAMAASGLTGCGAGAAASGTAASGTAASSTAATSTAASSTAADQKAPARHTAPGGTHHPDRGTGQSAHHSAAPPSQAHPLVVAASAYPLAQLIGYIGGTDVRVVDLAPPGAQPEGLALNEAQRAEIASAGLVVDVGDGYQPEVEAAAKSARHQIALLPAVSRNGRPYQFWLDPYLMSKAAIAVAAAMSQADPAAAHEFGDGSRDMQSVASSLASDFESTFTQCQDSYFVTADDAFGAMATSFGLVDVPVGTQGVSGAAAVISQRGLTAVFSEVGASPATSGLLEQVAHKAGVKIVKLNPMELAPAPGVNPQSYFAQMEDDLTAMEGPLECDTADNFS
ncbi:MAG TPA: metal ABC transporter substrate-binding protein [Acidimicrobiales bacterium]|nr:metal ABC transporter substrate-binding protein [Acidimicrobiales bacterium]